MSILKKIKKWFSSNKGITLVLRYTENETGDVYQFVYDIKGRSAPCSAYVDEAIRLIKLQGYADGPIVLHKMYEGSVDVDSDGNKIE